jgi:beta-phosphoglucomutase
MAIRAIIFDLDGTLADSEELHFDAFNTVLRPHGISISRLDYFSRLVGYDDRGCFSLLLHEHQKPGSDTLVAELITQKTRVYQAMISDKPVLFPGAAEFVRQCADRFPLTMVTGTLLAEAEMILHKAQLRSLFVDIVAAEDVERGKPEPDGFNAALGRLGFILRPHPSIVAAECLAIEDTAAGIQSARRAGMRVLAVAQTVTAARLAEADLVRSSLAETDLDEVLNRLAALD